MGRDARRRVAWAVGLVVAVVPVARAAILVTPPLVTDSGETLTCLLTNAGKKSLRVTLEAVNAAGAVVITSEGVVEPGRATFVSATTTSTATFCRFGVKGGGRRAVRAAACIRATADVPCGTTVVAQ